MDLGRLLAQIGRLSGQVPGSYAGRIRTARVGDFSLTDQTPEMVCGIARLARALGKSEYGIGLRFHGRIEIGKHLGTDCLSAHQAPPASHYLGLAKPLGPEFLGGHGVNPPAPGSSAFRGIEAGSVKWLTSHDQGRESFRLR